MKTSKCRKNFRGNKNKCRVFRKKKKVHIKICRFFRSNFTFFRRLKINEPHILNEKL